ncbi:flagellar assembly protein FliW [Cryobacterium tepidiphilum]|jgi:flagellar assembly factor FliW|uniref:Flagellar assembly protein FliW n=1 Tax=Cryobacterium tepidiphilum TaxID=2486026 RepID=A0A3M8LPA4_9MICO|nr:flagellar assembly protein FliW [Cryobacterium tepidiphilum]RNE66692.1 flagellar assembly protein FliW [Cryobacterium tepidiphilum]
MSVATGSAALAFVTPPPGLEPLVDFALQPIAGAAGLFGLQSQASPRTRLFVLDAGVYLPDYQPVISDEQVQALGLTSPDDALVLVVANPGEGGTSVNLMAPIVVNTRLGICAQVILDDQDFPLRASLAAPAA